MIKNIIKKVFKTEETKNINKNLAILLIENILKDKKYDDSKSLLRSGYKVFSQQDEDGIIDEIFNRIQPTEKIFIELGVETGVECNTTNLLYHNWKGLWVEAEKKYIDNIKKNFKLKFKDNLDLVHKKIDPDNVNSTLENYTKKISSNDIDLLSIDIGVHTYNVLKEIKVIEPKVIVAEYNAKYGPKINWRIDYDKNENWDGTDYYGASLKAFELMMREKGYILVGCNVTGVNAFFVKNNYVKDKFVDNNTSEYNFLEGRYWLKSAFSKNYKVRIK